MAIKNLLTLGIGVSPGSVAPLILLGLSTRPALSLDDDHAWRFELDGADITDYVDPDSVIMTDAEGAEIDTLYLELADPAIALTIVDYQEVRWIIDAGEATELVWFGGYIVNAGYTALEGALGRLWRLKCEGYVTLLARMATPRQLYVEQYPGDIAEALLDTAGLTSQDTEQGTLTITTDTPGVNVLRDTGQNFIDWVTNSGDAAYAVVVTHSDGTISWGFCGGAGIIGAIENYQYVRVYEDRELTTDGWNGVDPSTKTPTSYHVRRADPFSGLRPLSMAGVTTGTTALQAFATDADETLPAALTRLAQLVGWVWRVDAEAVFYFGPASNDPAPFDISDGANADYVTVFPALAGSVEVNCNGQELVNEVVVHGGAKESDPVTEGFTGDASTTVFALAHRNLIDITVSVDGVVVLDGTVWWATFGDRTVLVNYMEGWIWFDEAPAGLAAIDVVYRYWEPLLETERDDASIAARRQTFTRHVYDGTITTPERAALVAQAILDDYSNALVTGSLEVWRLGLRAGQQVHLTFDEHELDDDVTIRKVDSRIDPTNLGMISFVQFGGRTPRLSTLIGAQRQGYPPVSLGNVAGLINSARRAPANAVTTDGWVSKHDTTVIDATAGDVTRTLPPAAVTAGLVLRVIRVDGTGNTVEADTASGTGDTINGASSVSISGANTVVSFFSDGTQYFSW